MPDQEILTRDFQQTEIVLSVGGVTYGWGKLASSEDIFAEQEREVIVEAGGALLPRDELPDFVLGYMFQGNTVLEGTLEDLTGTSEFSRVWSCQLQAGDRAYIILHLATVRGCIIPFVSYLSRGPEGTALAGEARDNYNGLKYLNGEFQRRLQADIQRHFSVINPIAFGLSGEYEGKRYPFFTMPLSDRGELGLYVYPSNIGTNRILLPHPFFAYANPIGELEEEIQVRQFNQAREFGKQLDLIFNRLPADIQRSGIFSRRFKAELEKLPLAKAYFRGLDDLLTANALVFILSGGRFPKEFHVNAGDWMAYISRDGHLSLQLVTVRGGLGIEHIRDGNLDLQWWIGEMRNHIEPVAGYRELLRRLGPAAAILPQQIIIRPFEALTERQAHHIFERAQSMIVRR